MERSVLEALFKNPLRYAMHRRLAQLARELRVVGDDCELSVVDDRDDRLRESAGLRFRHREARAGLLDDLVQRHPSVRRVVAGSSPVA
jgi:hypothetical protein